MRLKTTRLGLFLLGRLGLGLFLILAGFNHFIYTYDLVSIAHFKGVYFPEFSVISSGLLLLFGGFSMLLGYRPLLGIAALILFFVPVTLLIHDYWSYENLEVAQIQMVHFLKNFAILSSVLMFAVIPDPWPISFSRKNREEIKIDRESVHVKDLAA